MQIEKNIYFIRHGECQANVDGVIAGASDDSPLTDFGRQQAKEAAYELKDITFDLIISSPLQRALDTAKIIAKELNIDTDEIIVSKEFIEKDVGPFTGKPKAEYYAFEKSGGETGETTIEMQDRVRQGLEWLRQQTFKNALVVTHNGTVRMARTVFENMPAKNFANMPQLSNGEYHKVNVMQAKF